MFRYVRPLSFLVLASAIAAVSCQTTAQAPSTPTQQDKAADEAAIRAVIARTETAINGRDFAAFAALFVPDGDLINADSPRSTGAEAIRQAIEAAWANAPAERRITITVENIRFLSADIAVVDTAARFSAGDPAQDRATSAMVRRDGEWRTAALRVFPAARQ